VQIKWPKQGDILNRHDGEADDQGGLAIEVTGVATGTNDVCVNDVPTEVRDGQFACCVPLTQCETTLKAVAPEDVGTEGEGCCSHRVTVLYDRDSFKRYRVSLDDNIIFLADIARHKSSYGSIFDNPYVAMWRELHERYGTLVHINIYYQMAGFNLTEFPDTFKGEWRDNAEWLRLTFHALQNNPRDPYIDAPADQVELDFHLVTDQIIRFAGEELLSPWTTVHWGECTREGCRALRRNGISGLAGYFTQRDGQYVVSYYLSQEQADHVNKRDYWHDFDEDITFVKHDMVMNTVRLDCIRPRLDEIARDPHESEIMELMIHEQHFHPEFRGYAPDYKERVTTALEWACENGYRPVFYDEGLVGNAEV